MKVAVAVLNSHQELNMIILNFKMKGYKRKFVLYDEEIKKHLMKVYEETDKETFDEHYDYQWRVIDNNIKDFDYIDYDDFIEEYETETTQE